jgi:hypothetical protein
MRRLRRGLCALLFAIPCLGIAATAAAQTFTADINGDGVRDRIEARHASRELVVRLSNREPPQHLAVSGSILDVVLVDIDKDGDSDLVATTRGRRHVRVFVWTNAGHGRLITGGPRPRVSRAHHQLSRRRLTAPIRPAADGDFSGDAVGLFVLTSIALQGRPVGSEPLHTADEPLVARLRHDRRSPRGPPPTLFFS